LRLTPPVWWPAVVFSCVGRASFPFLLSLTLVSELIPSSKGIESAHFASANPEFLLSSFINAVAQRFPPWVPRGSRFCARFALETKFFRSFSSLARRLFSFFLSAFGPDVLWENQRGFFLFLFFCFTSPYPPLPLGVLEFPERTKKLSFFPCDSFAGCLFFLPPWIRWIPLGIHLDGLSFLFFARSIPLSLLLPPPSTLSQGENPSFPGNTRTNIFSPPFFAHIGVLDFSAWSAFCVGMGSGTLLLFPLSPPTKARAFFPPYRRE